MPGSSSGKREADHSLCLWFLALAVIALRAVFALLVTLVTRGYGQEVRIVEA